MQEEGLLEEMEEVEEDKRISLHDLRSDTKEDLPPDKRLETNPIH